VAAAEGAAAPERPSPWEAGPEAGPWGRDEGARKKAQETAASDVGAGKGPEWAKDLATLAPPRAKEPWRLSHLMLLIAGIAVLLWTWVTLGMMTIPFAVIGLIVMTITSGFVLARLRTARQDALLSIIGIAAERGLPLGPAIAAFADQFRGAAHRRVMSIAAEIDAGMPLPDALEGPDSHPERDPHRPLRQLVWGRLGEQVYVEARGRSRAATRDTVLLARVGNDTGHLARALRLAGESRLNRIAAWSAVTSRLAYLLMVMLVAEGISGFMLFFIVPRLEAIFNDFGVRMPEVTIFMIQCSRWAVRFAPILDIFVLAQILLLLYIPFSYGGWMNYRLPIFDRLLVRRHAALILRALSVAMEGDRPIAPGLQTLAEHYPTRWVRRRLAKVLTDVRLGGDWIDSLLRARLIRRTDAEVLASASSVGNLSWACRELAATAERRQNLRMQVLVQALTPLAVVLLGLAVTVLCLGYFLPLVMLIERLAEL
jgi:protein transport protein HofC